MLLLCIVACLLFTVIFILFTLDIFIDNSNSYRFRNISSTFIYQCHCCSKSNDICPERKYLTKTNIV